MSDPAFIDGFLAQFDDSAYPRAFLERYEMLECLAHHEGGETFLVKDKRSGKARVAKCYPKSARPSAAIEQSLLNGRRRPGLPEMVEICENESMLCVVRAYIEGQPLDQAAREKPFTEKQAVGIITQLCETLIFLHAQQPSIIHRDIKPQNIIVDTEGNAVLIDFGIARAYAPEARADTVCFGTRHFAAPEQYGFSQTDARTDIYALGVLLGWLLTGESDIEAIRKKMPNGRLKAVALKCAAFDPCERYKNAAQVRDALSGRTRRRALLGALIAVGVVAASLFALSSAGYLPARQSERVRFTEPLIEQAARAALGKPPGAPLTEDDLLGVTDVLVMGDQAAADEDAYRALVDRFAVNDPAIQRGGIASLEDLALMPNLRRVWLAFQNISDISALAGLRYLEHVDLKHNPLEDISPLAGSTALEFLTLYDTRVKDFAALNGCPRLAVLDIGKTPLSDLSALQGLKTLRELHLGSLALRSLEPLRALPLLERLNISGDGMVELAPLLELPALRVVELSAARQAEGEMLLQSARFEIVYR